MFLLMLALMMFMLSAYLQGCAEDKVVNATIKIDGKSKTEDAFYLKVVEQGADKQPFYEVVKVDDEDQYNRYIEGHYYNVSLAGNNGDPYTMSDSQESFREIREFVAEVPEPSNDPVPAPNTAPRESVPSSEGNVPATPPAGKTP
jgi:hypothetical protein